MSLLLRNNAISTNNTMVDTTTSHSHHHHNNQVTVIVLEDEASERLSEGRRASCPSLGGPAKHFNKKSRRRRSLWGRLFRSSSSSSRATSNRSLSTAVTSDVRSTTRSCLSCQDSMVSYDEEEEEDDEPSTTTDDEEEDESTNVAVPLVWLEEEDACATTVPQEEQELTDCCEPVESSLTDNENDTNDCLEVCACHSYCGGGISSSTAVGEEDEASPSKEPASSSQEAFLDVPRLLEQAEMAYLAGDRQRCLEIYETVLQSSPSEHSPNYLDPVQRANLCYACTRLASDPVQALRYAKRELAWTKRATRSSCGSDTNTATTTATLAVSKCYHELARIAKTGLGESDLALRYYRTALRLEEAAYRNILELARIKNEDIHDSDTTMAMAAAKQEVLQNIQETKGCIGRILFEQGKVKEALWML